MQKDKRQDLIIELLQAEGKVATQDLAKKLSVSEDTVRRDLNEMAQKGLLSKIHGGAIYSIQKLYHYNDNVVKNQEEKNSIAKKAIGLLEDGMSIIISDGTTNLAFARNIPKNLKATVFTYCLPIALELTAYPGLEIIFLGGKVEKKSMVSLGNEVVHKFSNIHADICFLGTGSIGHEEGITEGSYEVSLIKQSIVTASDKVVSLATSNKLGQRQSYSICKPSEISYLITELEPTDDRLLEFSKVGVPLL